MAERSRRTGHRIGALAGSERWLVLGTIVVFAVVPFVAALITLGQGWQATGDVAIIGLRSRDAWTSHAPLVGQPTTGEEFTGRPSNHPGPAEYWILGPAIRLFGPRAGILIGTALVNGAALAGIVWLAFRRGGTPLLALVSVALAMLIRALGSGSLHDAFNSELATYPMLLALLAAWSVLVGDLRVTPVLVAAVAVAAQVHVAGASFCAPLVLVAMGSIGWVWRKHPRTVRRDAPYLLGALGLLLVTWLPPLVQELSAGPSNVSALLRTATAPRPRIGASFMFERLAAAVAPIPSFIKATGRFGFTGNTSAVGVLVAAAILAALASLGSLVRDRAGRGDVGRLGLLVLAATAISIWAGAGQPPLAAFRADGTRWLWVVSLAAWVTVAWAGWQLLTDHHRDRVRAALGPGAAALTTILLLVALFSNGLSEQRDGKLMKPTDRAALATMEALPKGRYHLQYEGNQALITVGPGIAYRLEDAGYHVQVDDNAFDRGYGSQRTNGAPVAGRIRISSTNLDDPHDGERLIAAVPITGNGGRTTTIRVYAS
jgi:hypothetical protein